LEKRDGGWSSGRKRDEPLELFTEPSGPTRTAADAPNPGGPSPITEPKAKIEVETDDES